MEKKPQESFHTYFFIESHPTSLGKDVLLKLRKKNNKAAQPLTKVLEKEFKLADGKQDFLFSVYSGTIMGSSLKNKEIIVNENKFRTLEVKLALKVKKKNKFTTKIFPYIDYDYFLPFVKFDPMKKLIGKPIDPPPQINLTPFNYITLFTEALLISLKKQPNDPTFLEFLKYCVFTLKSFEKMPFKLFLLIYEKILYSQNLELISTILELFFIKAIEEPKSQQEIIMYKESIMRIFKNQNIFLDNIKNIQNVSFFSNLSKFYYIIFFYFFILHDIKSIEDIIIDLRDNNKYDKLIVAKLFLADVNNFYRTIPISNEIKISLIDGYLQASETYENLLTSFSLIKEYTKGDMIQILTILVNHYDKIHQICFKLGNVLKLDDYIIPNMLDKIDKIQDSLTILGQKKLSYGYKAISIRHYTWTLYINNGKNPEFFEFLSSHLIQVSLNFNDIRAALDYFIPFTQKDVGKMMKLFVKNYDKLETICQNEKTFIDASNYLEASKYDDTEVIKENFDFILSRKFRANFETINFPIRLWNSYIKLEYKKEFLLYIEGKLLEDASTYENIIDCLTFASSHRKNRFIEILQFIIENFEKINNFVKLNDKIIDFTEFYRINKKEDNMGVIYELLSQLIKLEVNKNYKTVDFPMKIWAAYMDSKDLEYLRTIRKIIKKLYEMDSTLDEDAIKLPKRIHEVGYLYIKSGKLKDEQLIEFLGKEEAYYNNHLYDGIMDKGKEQRKQIDTHENKINVLEEEYNIITGRSDFCRKELETYTLENNKFVTKINNLANTVSNLISRINSIKKDIGSLKLRFTN